jgi:hypothetical protein
VPDNRTVLVSEIVNGTLSPRSEPGVQVM